MASKRVLITGLNGFTGKYMADEMLAAGWEVHGIGADPAPLDRYRVVDLADLGSLRSLLEDVRPDAVIHLAGLAFVGHGDANAFYTVNLLGTRNLLQALHDVVPAIQCVLLASSANVYGNAAEGVLSEESPARPANDYAVSKLSMEYMARLWMSKLPVVIARPFNYTGVGQSESFLLPKIVRHYREHAPEIELGNIDVSRDFSDVRAVASAYRLLIERCPASEIVNVCSGRALALREVLGLMAAEAGYEIRVKVNPAFVRANEVRSLSGSADKLRALIGEWESPPLAETLRWMLRAPEA